jgi:hypothetical protein
MKFRECLPKEYLINKKYVYVVYILRHIDNQILINIMQHLHFHARILCCAYYLQMKT